MALSQAQIQENVVAIKEQGGSDTDVQEYLQSVNVQEKAPSPADSTPATESQRVQQAAQQFISKRGGRENVTEADIEQFVQQQLEREKGQRGLIGRTVQTFTGLPDVAAKKAFKAPFQTPTEQVGEAIGAVGRGAVKSAPLFVGGPTKGLGLIKRAGAVGGIVGTSEAVDQLLEGEGVKTAAKKGIATGLVSGVFSAGLDKSFPVVKAALKQVIGSISKVKNFAVQRAIKNPKILTTAQKSIVEAGDDVVGMLDDFGKKIGDDFDNALNKLKIPKGKAIKMDNLPKIIKNKEINTAVLKQNLKKQIREEALDMSDKVIDRFLDGKNIGFQEARKLNKFLGNVARSAGIDKPAFASRVQSVKTALLNNMENQVPGIRSVNKAWAQKNEIVKKAFKDITSNKETKETTLKAIGQQLGGTAKNKTQAINRLLAIQKETGSDAIENLLNSVASDEFATASGINVVDLILGTSGGPAGIGFVAARTPGGTQALIRGGQSLAPVAQKALAPAAAVAGPEVSKQLIRRRRK